MNNHIIEITERIAERSVSTRTCYLKKIEQAYIAGPARSQVSCTNLAHDVASASDSDKLILKQRTQHANIAIVSAYNDLLSAHQPYGNFPDLIKKSIAKKGHVAQFAAGVPAMCDGITQGQPGMELSLFSRDVIAMSTAVALSHNVFDGGLYLGICDKIVPGLLIAALEFGHLPAIFVPAGPMPTGIPNKEKAHIRQQYAEGLIDSDALLEAEVKSYHSPGTCTFYGTANSNQMLMEFLGLHLPGSSFIPPGSDLRNALTERAAERICEITALEDEYTPLGNMIDEKSIVNAMVGLIATGGSTNHTIHLVAIARAAGFIIDWDDFASLSKEVPLLARVYPNGDADINQFNLAGGVPFVIKELLALGLLHNDVSTITGQGLEAYTTMPQCTGSALTWSEITHTQDKTIIRQGGDPFAKSGGICLIQGDLGRAIVKLSAVPAAHHAITAPAVVFSSQEAVKQAFEKGRLDKHCVIVVKNQGPRANGMPELHKLMPPLGVLQDRGYNVALVTDGRLSGASGKVLSVIHMTPESIAGGFISRVEDGDIIEIDATSGTLTVSADLASRAPNVGDQQASTDQLGAGRNLFNGMRSRVISAEEGATTFQ
ncbi:phosphogluconate dehydratase [Alkalimarinus alittae]|uniref:Phosphogluconate dehydratase n=1 Tax=Alkalimarinus alittae TaxID=2961619 RepID=A0ABY6MXK5_9ALTE|nr:phosphogluconate dehydratase [Alkalimarinus alittae]UZE94556.1 phosphogluconate dehydratase [Alkalimarinus alittae]